MLIKRTTAGAPATAVEGHQDRRMGALPRQMEIANELVPIVFGIDHARLGGDLFILRGRVADRQRKQGDQCGDKLDAPLFHD